MLGATLNLRVAVSGFPRKFVDDWGVVLRTRSTQREAPILTYEERSGLGMVLDRWLS